MRLFQDIHLPPLTPDEDKNYGDSRKWWRHVQAKNMTVNIT